MSNTLDDDLRERLLRLGRGATAGSRPWPGVDHAIRRQRTRGMAWTSALAVVALLVSMAVARGGRPDPEPPAPARPEPAVGGLPYRNVAHPADFPKPWAAPPGPYVEQYQARRLQLPGTPGCRQPHVLDLSRPWVQQRAGLSDAVRTPCRAPDAPGEGPATGEILFPLPWTPVPAGAGPEQCAAGLRDPSWPGPGRLAAGSTFCVLTAMPRDAAPGLDGMIARFTVTAIDGAGTVYLEATAWLGSGPNV